jgi:heavy metal sensor kinase
VRPSALSIRVRLTLWYAAGLLLILACLSTGIYLLVRERLERAMDAQLDRDVATIAAVITAFPAGDGPTRYLPGDVRFLVTDGQRVLYESDGWCRSGLVTAFPLQRPCIAGAWRSREGTTYSLRTTRLQISGRYLQVFVAEDTGVSDDILRRLSRVFLLYLPIAVLLSAGGGHFLAGRVLAPISKMASKAQAITAESLSERLPVENPHDELGRMATAFNATLSRLEDSFERLRAFTANVSHELRTPLTAMRSVGEVAVQRPLGEGACREVIGSMLEEVDRLTRLVDCMLCLARAESGRAQLPREKMDLVAMAQGVVDLVRVLAEEKGQSLTLAADQGTVAEGDPATLRQALMDLVDNAIRYTPAGGKIQVRAGAAPDGSPILEVEDNGPGIGAEDRDRIFDRFFRTDPGQGESKRGVGLGLAIARSAVEANGGRLEYEDAAGGGSRFRITLTRPTRAS